MPKLDSGGRAPILPISSRSTLCSAPSRPPPPYSFGQSGTVQPLSRMRSNQTRCGSDENLVLRPPQNTSPSPLAGLRISGGQLASSQARVSRRNCSRSDMCVSINERLESTLVAASWISISPSSRHAVGAVVMRANRVYSRRAITVEKQEETVMRLKLLSPGEMSAAQKETYDEAIAGKRGAPPAPMMAWLNSPEMAKHATRLGEVMRFNTMFPAKALRDRDPRHRAALYLALRVVRPQAPRAEGRHGPANHRGHPPAPHAKPSTIPRAR